MARKVMTLVPDRNFAAEFNPGEVDNYIQTFRNAAEPKFGEHGRKYNDAKWETSEGRVYVLVTQARS
jgi:hypothetical protein